jgi:hypothetical protein
MKTVPDWAIQASWWVSGIFATGAIWYCLSVQSYAYAAGSAGGAGAFAALAIVLHRKKDATDKALAVHHPESDPSLSPTQGGPWRCGIYDYPPLSSWPSQSGAEPTGPLVLLAREVAHALGHSVTFELFTYDDFYADLNAIPDIIVGMFETKRRATRVAFSRSIYEIGLQGICRADQQGDVLRGLREGRLKVAVYSSEVGWEFVQDELPDAISEHRVATLVGGHQMHTMALLTEDAYDVVIMDHLSCRNFLNDPANRQRFRLAFDEPPQKYRACLAVRKEHSSLLPSIDSTLLTVRNSSMFLQSEQEALRGLERVIERRGLRSNLGGSTGLRPSVASQTQSRGG